MNENKEYAHLVKEGSEAYKKWLIEQSKNIRLKKLIKLNSL